MALAGVVSRTGLFGFGLGLGLKLTKYRASFGIDIGTCFVF